MLSPKQLLMLGENLYLERTLTAGDNISFAGDGGDHMGRYLKLESSMHSLLGYSLLGVEDLGPYLMVLRCFLLTQCS